MSLKSGFSVFDFWQRVIGALCVSFPNVNYFTLTWSAIQPGLKQDDNELAYFDFIAIRQTIVTQQYTVLYTALIT